jgi:gluconate 2-dehydrogenase gamma chain
LLSFEEGSVTPEDDNRGAGRRAVLKLVGVGAVAALPLPAAAQQPAKQAGGAMPGMAMPAPRPESAPAAAAAAGKPPAPSYVYFNPDEQAFIEAAVDTFIPADEYTAGGVDLGVSEFVDRQLASGYGRGDRLYLQGPFLEGTPEQGYQMSLTPADLIRAGILDLEAYVKAKYNTTFDALAPADRVAVLTDLEHGRIALATVPTEVFFGVLFQLVMDGFFSDPIYGGNRGKASWKMLGYPGVGEMYADKIEKYRNKPYVVEPKSIQDFL